MFVNSREMDIFRVRPDNKTKVSSIRLGEKDLRSESSLRAALKHNVKDLDDGMYSVHPANALFARFELINHSISRLERWSENTGILMPCWNYFEN
ncbi:hypothetical protein KY345_00540 [Candidatus Woesearchaeota archaeon]|nr:hypothetical protein [Candidatus Woesearchaeota archaeon]